MIISHFSKPALDQDLGLSVGCNRIKGSGLIVEIVTGCTVCTARRGKDKSRNTGRFCQIRQPHRGMKIDVVCQVSIKVAEGVIRQCGEMYNGIEALNISPREITEVLRDRRDFLGRLSKIAASEQVRVETDHLMTGRHQDRTSHNPNVSFMTSQKNPHNPPARNE